MGTVFSKRGIEMLKRLWVLSFVPVVLLGAFVRADVIEIERFEVAPTYAPVQVDTVVAEETVETEEGGEAETIDTPPTKAEPLDPQFVRLQLRDGSIIAGRLTVPEIEVATEFGKLIVPIDKIRSFTPGIDSNPEIANQLNTLIEDLGGEDFKLREAAHKALVKLGPSVRKQLEPHRKDENAERARHAQEILTAFEEMTEDVDEFEEGSSRELWIRDDTVVTTEFTIVGKISPQTFNVESKYGPLTVQLADVQVGERKQGPAEEINRRFSVAGQNLVQRSFKSAGVRVNRGDRVSIRAEGQIIMSPWGSNSISTPDGGANYGWYVNNKIPGGALVAKVGTSGEVFKVGGKHTFVAKKAGSLHFAIAMQPSYSGSGYNFPGEYKVRLKIEPGAEE
jgi:hypothetical protein